LGSGKDELEIFIEPTCPFSKRAFEKITLLLETVGDSKLTIKVRFVSQPWHLSSAVVTRCILAATATTGGKQTGLAALNAVYNHREEFESDDHCSGPGMQRSPQQTIAYVSGLCDVDLFEAFKLSSVDRALRWHTRYCRQNGVHVSPSFAINRLINNAMSSGQTVEEWARRLGFGSVRRP
jgi:hypothetical protein